MEEMLKNIKQEPSVEFLCCLPRFDEEKTLGGKTIKIKREKIEKNEEIKDFHFKISKFLCEVCNKGFRLKSDLSQHAISHDKVQCQICNGMVRKSSFENHLKTHENEKERKFQCKLCPKKFTTQSYLFQHQKVHEEKQLSCDLCGTFCSVKKDLLTHLGFHFREGKYKCLKCRQLFDLQNDLKCHSMTRQMNPEICQQMKDSNFNCRTCGKEFTTNGLRKQHEKVHMDKVECPICHAKLSQVSIKQHLKNHKVKEGEKKFKCSECQRTFWTKDFCIQHEKTHNKFNCDHCGYKIANKTYFVEHMMTHFNPQTFDCKDCEKKFSTKTNLKKHITGCHPSESNGFRCEICQKTFKIALILKRHKKVHEPRKTCPICSTSLSVRSYPHHIKMHQSEQKLVNLNAKYAPRSLTKKNI